LIHGTQEKSGGNKSHLEQMAIYDLKPKQLTEFLRGIRAWRKWIESATGINPLVEKHRKLMELVNAIHGK